MQERDFEGKPERRAFRNSIVPSSQLLECVSKAGRLRSKFLDELLLGLKISKFEGWAMAWLYYCCALAPGSEPIIHLLGMVSFGNFDNGARCSFDKQFYFFAKHG